MFHPLSGSRSRDMELRFFFDPASKVPELLPIVLQLCQIRNEHSSTVESSMMKTQVDVGKSGWGSIGRVPRMPIPAFHPYLASESHHERNLTEARLSA